MTDHTPPTAGPPSGWYLDPAGQQRWWDGERWGAAAFVDKRTVESAGRNMALVSWFGLFLMSGLPTLAIRLAENRGNRFARWHASEALNVQLTLVTLWLPIFLPVWGWMMLSVMFSDSQTDIDCVFLILAGIGGALMVTTIVCVAIGAVCASRGTWWRCPIAIPYLRAHRRERAAELESVAAGHRDGAVNDGDDIASVRT